MDGKSVSAGSDAIGFLGSQGVLAFGHLLEGYQRLVAAVEDDLKDAAGMSIAEIEVLIRLANEPGNQLRPGKLANKCVMSTSGCSRLLDRLEDQQLVARRPHPTDRRGLVVVLSPRGRALLGSVLPMHYESLERHLWSVLTEAEIGELSNAMRKVRDANIDC